MKIKLMLACLLYYPLLFADDLELDDTIPWYNNRYFDCKLENGMKARIFRVPKTEDYVFMLNDPDGKIQVEVRQDIIQLYKQSWDLWFVHRYGIFRNVIVFKDEDQNYYMIESLTDITTDEYYHKDEVKIIKASGEVFDYICKEVSKNLGFYMFEPEGLKGFVKSRYNLRVRKFFLIDYEFLKFLFYHPITH